VAERGIHRGGDDQAGDLRPGDHVGVPAGQQHREVGGGHDHVRRAAALARHGPGEQPGQDGPGCGGCAGAGQAEPAEGGDVGADLVAVADSQRDHARRPWPVRRVAGAACGRGFLPGPLPPGRAAACPARGISSGDGGWAGPAGVCVRGAVCVGRAL
jgi:hypothetical protein